jgi:hypothetical protein
MKQILKDRIKLVQKQYDEKKITFEVFKERLCQLIFDTESETAIDCIASFIILTKLF